MPSCVETWLSANQCSPDFSNPLQWLEFYGRLWNLPPEFGIGMLLLIITGAIYIRTHNMMLTAIAGLLSVSFFASSAFGGMASTAVAVMVIAVAVVMVLFIYKIKGEITS